MRPCIRHIVQGGPTSPSLPRFVLLLAFQDSATAGGGAACSTAWTPTSAFYHRSSPCIPGVWEQIAGESIDPLFDQVAERYRKIVADLGLDFDLDPALAEVHDRIAGGAGPDYAASRGEFLSGVILSKLLDRPLIDPATMIRFDADGRFLPEDTQKAVADRLGAEACGIVPGFYGALPDGSIKTFSRGGSDITGAIVSRGVGASAYENWTDVSGLLMTDPRIVNAPRTIDELTYRELRELAYMGATVLHDEAIFPVREVGIPVHIKNTNAPDDAGTRITRGGLDQPPTGTITGIAGRKDFTIIALEKTSGPSWRREIDFFLMPIWTFAMDVLHCNFCNETLSPFFGSTFSSSTSSPA